MAAKVNPVESVRSTEPIVELPDEHEHQQEERKETVEIHSGPTEEPAVEIEPESTGPIQPEEEETPAPAKLPVALPEEAEGKQPDEGSEMESAVPVNGTSPR